MRIRVLVRKDPNPIGGSWSESGSELLFGSGKCDLNLDETGSAKVEKCFSGVLQAWLINFRNRSGFDQRDPDMVLEIQVYSNPSQWNRFFVILKIRNYLTLAQHNKNVFFLFCKCFMIFLLKDFQVFGKNFNILLLPVPKFLSSQLTHLHRISVKALSIVPGPVQIFRTKTWKMVFKSSLSKDIFYFQ